MACLRNGSFVAVGLVLACNAAAPKQLAAWEDPPGAASAGVHRDRFGDELPADAVGRLGTMRFRCAGPVYSVGFSPDGRTLLSTEWNSFQQWDVATGKLQRRVAVHPGAVLSPNGKILAGPVLDDPPRKVDKGKVIDKDKALEDILIRGLFDPAKIVFWEADTGKEVRRWEAKLNHVISFQFSPDGQRIATISSEGLQVWNVDDGNLLWRSLERQAEDLGAVLVSTRPRPLPGGAEFSPDGKILVFGAGRAGVSGKSHVRFYSADKGEILADIEAESYQRLSFSPDGAWLAGSSEKGDLQVWDVSTKKLVHTLGAGGEGRGVLVACFSPDGKRLASGTADGSLHLWDVETGRELRPFAGHPHPVVSLAFSPDGKTLAAGTCHNAIHLWETATGQERLHFEGHEAPITSSAVSGRRRLVATASEDGEVRLWDATSLRPSFVLSHPHWVGAVAFAPDGKTLAAGSGKTLCFWDTTTGKKVREWAVKAPMESLLYSPDGKFLAGAAGGESHVALWNVASAEMLYEWKIDDGYGVVFAFSSDGKTLAADGRTWATTLLWDTATGERLKSPEFVRRPSALHFSADGSVLSGYNQGSILSKELSSGKTISEVDISLRFPIAYRMAAFSQDGKKLVVVIPPEDVDDGCWMLSMFDSATGKNLRQWKGLKAAPLAVAFSPDGKKLISAGEDTSALVWSVDGVGEVDAVTPGQALHDLPPPDQSWADLADENAAIGYRAVHDLAIDAKHSVPLLREKMRPVPPPNARRIERWIADLDSEEYPVREKAARDLEALADLAGPALRKALRGQPSLEQGLRLERLLQTLSARNLTPDELRDLRAVEVLEWVNTPASRDLLRLLAEGTPEARLTKDAEAALKRLEKLGG